MVTDLSLLIIAVIVALVSIFDAWLYARSSLTVKRIRPMVWNGWKNRMEYQDEWTGRK